MFWKKPTNTDAGSWRHRCAGTFLAVRRHISYPKAAMAFALLLAMSGGAVAAAAPQNPRARTTKHKPSYVISSLGQISPSVRSMLKGANGKNGVNGTNGSSGLAGVAGKEGLMGKEGAAGKTGESVTTEELKVGDAHCKLGGAKFTVGSATPTFACNGQTGFTQTLPKGDSETGTWQIAVTKVPSLPLVSVSFAIPLSEKPAKIEVVNENGKTTECPGTAAEPLAKPGVLCLFEAVNSGKVKFEFALSYTAGVLLEFGLVENEFAAGTWAVKAEE
ncbi:MAG: hypothetical protein WB698_04650 [Solirubrobacteraceae bacterium]